MSRTATQSTRATSRHAGTATLRQLFDPGIHVIRSKGYVTMKTAATLNSNVSAVVASRIHRLARYLSNPLRPSRFDNRER